MTFYQLAHEDTTNLLDQVIQSAHKRLAEAGASIDLIMAYASADGRDAITVRGVPCLARVRILRLKDRVAGLGDAQIELDGDRWKHHPIKKKRAIIDHELTHLALAQDMYGKVKRDDLDRPKFKMRLHDHEHGWFDEVVERHGNDSVEVEQFSVLCEILRQNWLPFMGPDVQQAKLFDTAKEGKRKR